MTGEHLLKAKGALAAAQPLDPAKDTAYHFYLRIAEVQALVAIAEALEDRRAVKDMKADGTLHGYV